MLHFVTGLIPGKSQIWLLVIINTLETDGVTVLVITTISRRIYIESATYVYIKSVKYIIKTVNHCHILIVDS